VTDANRADNTAHAPAPLTSCRGGQAVGRLQLMSGSAACQSASSSRFSNSSRSPVSCDARGACMIRAAALGAPGVVPRSQRRSATVRACSRESDARSPVGKMKINDLSRSTLQGCTFSLPAAPTTSECALRRSRGRRLPEPASLEHACERNGDEVERCSSAALGGAPAPQRLTCSRCVWPAEYRALERSPTRSSAATRRAGGARHRATRRLRNRHSLSTIGSSVDRAVYAP
jgi:hypothetical protein